MARREPPSPAKPKFGLKLFQQNIMEKDWPILEECPQYRHGLMSAAMIRYPWEEDGYVFDFDSFYPPIPDEPRWFRKLLESTKNKVRPPFPEVPPEEDIDCCPICLPLRRYTPPDITPWAREPVPMTSNHELWNELMKEDEMQRKEMREHPVWNMDPIPCPFHILDHFYHPLMDSGEVMSPPSLVTREQLESTKQFLKEVRATRGYNVKSTPHPALVSSYGFEQHDLDSTINLGSSKSTRREILIERYLNPLIDHINFKTGKIYKLVEILKSVPATPLLLLTFSASASPAPQQTFIATVSRLSLCPSYEIRPGSNPNILECLLLPDYDAPCKTRPWNEVDIRRESFSFIENKIAAYLGTAETTKRSSRWKRKLVEIGEGSHTSARKRQKRGPCVAGERETGMTLCEYFPDSRAFYCMDTSKMDNLIEIVKELETTHDQQLDLEFVKLMERKFELEAELAAFVSKLSLESH